VDFTREPIIETVVTAKEGCKLVVRSSKGVGQEEYFVDAVEVVSFGNSFFFRSVEKPKAFLVPTSDYEVLEVREARMVLKNVGGERGSRSTSSRETKQKESAKESEEPKKRGGEKKRERKRSFKRRRQRGKEEGQTEGEESESAVELPEPKEVGKKQNREAEEVSSSVLKSLLPPPPNLISETIEKYKDDESFRDAFYDQEEKGEEAAEAAGKREEDAEEAVSKKESAS